MAAFEIPIDADFTVPLEGMRRASLNLQGASVTYVNTGVTGNVKLYESDGTTLVATGGTLTYDTGSNGIWYSAFDAESLTEGDTYILVVTITAPVDDVRTLTCTAVKRGGKG